MPSTPVTATDWGMPPQRALQPPLINHIYKETGVRNIGNKPEFRRATTTLLGAQKLLWFHPQQTGQRTTSISVIADISSIAMYFTVK